GTSVSGPSPPYSDNRKTRPSYSPHLTRAGERNLTDPGSEFDLPLESLSSIAEAYIYACAQSAPRHPSTTHLRRDAVRVGGRLGGGGGGGEPVPPTGRGGRRAPPRAAAGTKRPRAPRAHTPPPTP